jgi:hypothetical protein
MKNIFLILVVIFCTHNLLYGKSEYKNRAKLVSSGAVWSSNSEFQHFGAIGEPIVSSYVANQDVNGTLGFLYSDNLASINPPQAAVLIYPPDNSVLSGSSEEPLTVSFYWVQQDNVIFHLQVAQNKYFSPKLIDTTVEVNYFTARLSSEGIYFWRVLATRGSVSADWSPTWNFTVVVTGVEDEANTRILPNPAYKVLHINVERKFVGGAIKIIDLYGRTRLTAENINSDNVVDLSGLESGVYFVFISNGGYIIRRKIVKIK